MKFLAIIEGTIREALAKKTLLGMFIVSTLMILVCLGLFQIDAVKTGLASVQTIQRPNAQQQAFQASVGTVLDVMWMIVSGVLLYFSVFVGVFVCAGFITSMMEKGTVDLLLSKPVPRWMYVVGRYTGGLVIMLFEVGYLILGMWLVAGVSLGMWSGGFLVSILYITLAFASIYSMVVLFAIVTKSSWFAVIITYALAIFAGLLLPLAKFFDRLLTGDDSGTIATIGKIVRYTIPHPGDLSTQMVNTILHRDVDFVVILVALGLSLVYLGAASYVFSKKEF